MLMLPTNIRVWVAAKPIDMRKGCFSLAAFVQQEFQLDPKTNHLFVFFGRSKDKVKILHWDRNGFALWYKCLSEGRYRLPKIMDKRFSISLSDLSLLLEGIDLNSKERFRAI